MAIPALVVAGTKIIASTAAAAGISKVTSNIFNNSSAKKTKSLIGCATDNQQHARNFFNEFLANPASDYWQKGFLDTNDLDAMVDITNRAIETIGSNPEFGIGASYTSQYTGRAFNTAPTAGYAKWVDDYITSKITTQTQQLQTAVDQASNNVAPGEVTTFQDLFNSLSSIYNTSTKSLTDKLNSTQATIVPQIEYVGIPGETQTVMVPTTEVTSEPVNYNKFLIYGAIGLFLVFFLFKR